MGLQVLSDLEKNRRKEASMALFEIGRFLFDFEQKQEIPKADRPSTSALGIVLVFRRGMPFESYRGIDRTGQYIIHILAVIQVDSLTRMANLNLMKPRFGRASLSNSLYLPLPLSSLEFHELHRSCVCIKGS